MSRYKPISEQTLPCLPSLSGVKNSLGLPSVASTRLGSLARTRPSQYLSLGTTDSGDQVSLIGPSLKSHTHIIGATRYGKSKLVEHLLRQKLSATRSGFILIDPHGKLYEDMVHYLSHKRPSLARKVVLFDPAGDSSQMIGFNPIPSDSKNNPEYVVDNLVSSCLKAWKQDNADATPRIKRWLQNIFHVLIANDLTLLEAAALLNPSDARHRKNFSQVAESMVRVDWELFDRLHFTKQWEMLEGPSNRLRKFLMNPYIRTIIGGQTNQLDIKDIMDSGKILLVNLDGRDRISHENMRFLGNLLVSEIFRCAMLRDHRDPRLFPCDVVIDEFPDYVNREAARILDQAGKKQVWLWLLHQHLDQLDTSDSEDDRAISASIKTNCQTKIVFGGLSRKDAEVMSKELLTGFLGVEDKLIKDERYATKIHYEEDMWDVLSVSRSTSEGQQRSQSEGSSWSHTDSIANSIGQSESTSSSEGRSTSHQYSDSESHSHATGSGSSEQRSISGRRDNYDSEKEMLHKGSGTSRNTSESSSYNSSYAESSSVQKSEGRSRSESQSQTTGQANSEGGSTIRTTGESSNQSESYSITQQPFFRPIEYQELASRTYWSVEELTEIGIAQIKNLKKQWAIIKQGSNKPVKLKVDTVKSVYFSRVTSPGRIERFEKRVQSHHPHLYQDQRDVKQEIIARHQTIFDQPLFDDLNEFAMQLRRAKQEPKKLQATNQEPSQTNDAHTESSNDPPSPFSDTDNPFNR